MMLPDARLHGAIEGGVSVVAGIVNVVYERRPLVAAGAVWPMAGRAIISKYFLPRQSRL